MYKPWHSLLEFEQDLVGFMSLMFLSFNSLSFCLLQVDPQEKKKKKTGRAKRRMQYNRRFVNVVATFGRRRGPNSNAPWTSAATCSCLYLATDTCMDNVMLFCMSWVLSWWNCYCQCKLCVSDNRGELRNTASVRARTGPGVEVITFECRMFRVYGRDAKMPHLCSIFRPLVPIFD